MKKKIKERECSTNKKQYNRFYLADKDLKGTPFEIGQHFSYDIDFDNKKIKIVPDNDSKAKGTVCRQRVGDHHVPLIVIRGKKIEQFAGSSKSMKVTIFEDEIIVTPIEETKTSSSSLKNGFTTLCKNVLSFQKTKEEIQSRIIFSRKNLKKVANDQLSLFDLGYSLSEDSITQTLSQTETFEHDLEPLSHVLRVFEAFAGIGSQRMALKNIGVNHEVVAIAENVKFALQSYEAIHGDCPNLGDIKEIKIEDVPDHDLFTYSFPCTDVSIEGKKKGLKEGSGTRSATIWDCEAIIKAKKPKYLMLENVKNLVGKTNIADFNEWTRRLTSMGYCNYWKILDGVDYGMPQHRERVFMISILGPHLPFEFPKEEELTITAKELLEPSVDSDYYLEAYDWMLDAVDPTILNVPQATKQGYIPLTVPGICDLTRMTSKNRRGRVQMNGDITPTIPATKNDICYVDYVEATNSFRARRLTEKERWRLMGFKDSDFEKAKQSGVSLSQLSHQAGNSIIVNVLEKIFLQLFKGTNFLSIQ